MSQKMPESPDPPAPTPAAWAAFWADRPEVSRRRHGALTAVQTAHLAGALWYGRPAQDRVEFRRAPRELARGNAEPLPRMQEPPATLAPRSTRRDGPPREEARRDPTRIPLDRRAVRAYGQALEQTGNIDA